MLIDTHCHLYPEFGFVTKTPEEIVENSIKAGVLQMWLAATEKADIEWNFEFCKKFPQHLKTWVGWHPEQYLSFDKDFLGQVLAENLSSKLQNNKSQDTRNKQFTNIKLQTGSSHPGGSVATDRILLHTDSITAFQNDTGKANTKYQMLDTIYSPIVGIGEVGVDLAVHPKSSTNAQQQVFEEQIKLAQRYKLPVAIHCRDAFDETVEVMEKYPDVTFLWHCFNLSSEKTKKILNKFTNLYCAFNAIFTYKSGEYLKDSIKLIPVEKIVLETDGPFLAPRPFKYEFNTPEGVIEVYRAVSDSLNIPLEKLSALVEENSNRLITNS